MRLRLNFAGFLLILLTPVAASPQGSGPGDLTQMSLEELMDVQVTSVSKKEQTLSKVGAAVFVIGAEDIRRSGATNIPDLLRLAPGVHVAQMDANTWAVSIRGFSDRYGDKVLVLIDGRSVYTPTSSGVDWDEQEVPMEDIERIEIIRGPGGTVWGANAVNGVINIITRSAKDTQGGLASAAAGSQKTADSLAQYGGKIGGKGFYRVFGGYSNFGNSPSPAGERLTDGWHKVHGGFRSDWDVSPRDSMTVQGDLFQSRESQTMDTLFANQQFREATIDDRISTGSGDILGRWSHKLANGSEMILQSYFDRYNRLDAGLGDIRDTFDVDFQHHLAAGSRHDIVWGFGYRITSNSTTPGYAKSYLPAGRTDNLGSTFVQDEIKLGRSVRLTVGSKFEHNSYTGFEYEPSAQLVWNVSNRNTLWTSAARAIRQPALADVAIEKYTAAFDTEDGGFGVGKIVGTPGRKAERVHDFEAGYRAQMSKQLSLDVAAFSSYYYGLQTAEPGDPYYTSVPPPLHLVMPTLSDDLAHAHNYGAEISVNWSAARRWKLSAAYSFIQMHVAADPASMDDGVSMIAYDTPKNQFQVHSFVNLTRRLEWDSALYYTGKLGDSGDGPTDRYYRLDTRLGYKVGESVELSVVGQNLATPRHAEFHDDEMFRTLVARKAFGRIVWRF